MFSIMSLHIVLDETTFDPSNVLVYPNRKCTDCATHILLTVGAGDHVFNMFSGAHIESFDRIFLVSNVGPKFKTLASTT